MAGRLAGLARDLVLASVLGLSQEADVAIVILVLPDLLVNLLLSGGLGVALVPLLRNSADVEVATLFFKASVGVSIVFAIIGAIVALFPNLWFGLLAPGIALPIPFNSSWAFYALGAALPLTALSGVTSAALNARGRFLVAGCGTLIFNTIIIGALLLGGGMMNLLEAVSWGILIGALLRWISQLANLPAVYSLPQGKTRLLTRNVARAFIAGLLTSSLLILAPVIIRASASLLGAGKIAAISYALKLVELPVGVLFTSIVTVLYPTFCQLYAGNEIARSQDLFRTHLTKILIFSIAVVVPGWAYADAVSTIIFQRGRVSVDDAHLIAELFRVLLLSVPCVAISSLTATWLNARDQPGRVMFATLACLALLALSCIYAVNAGASVQQLTWVLPAFYLALTTLLIRVARIVFWGRHGALPMSRIFLLGKVVLVAFAISGLGYLPISFAYWGQVVVALTTFCGAAGFGLLSLRTLASHGESK